MRVILDAVVLFTKVFRTFAFRCSLASPSFRLFRRFFSSGDYEVCVKELAAQSLRDALQNSVIILETAP
jgi:hypothetical protein